MVEEMLRQLIRDAVREELSGHEQRIGEIVARVSSHDRDEYLTTAQAARTLGLHQDTVRELVKSGKLPRREVAGKLRFARSDLDRLLGVEARIETGEGRTADEIVKDMLRTA